MFTVQTLKSFASSASAASHSRIASRMLSRASWREMSASRLNDRGFHASQPDRKRPVSTPNPLLYPS